MKKVFFIVRFMIAGLLLNVSTGLAHDKWAEEGQAILNRIKLEESGPSTLTWENTGPTAADLQAATKVEHPAIKGSKEDKLINAVKNGDLKNVKLFIAAGVDLEAKDDQDRTALMRAAEKGDYDILRTLLDAGSKVTTKDGFGWTAFFIAADKNHIEIVKMLMANGAASDKNFKDIFISAAFKGNTEMVKALMVNTDIDYDTLDTAYSVINKRNTELYNLIVEALNKKSQEQ